MEERMEAALRGCVERYEEAVDSMTSRLRPGDGVLGMGRDPRRDPCHMAFYEEVGETVARFQATEPEAGEVVQAVRFPADPGPGRPAPSGPAHAGGGPGTCPAPDPPAGAGAGRGAGPLVWGKLSQTAAAAHPGAGPAGTGEAVRQMSENQRRPGGGLSVPGPFPQGQRKKRPFWAVCRELFRGGSAAPEFLMKRKAALWAAEQKRKTR